MILLSKEEEILSSNGGKIILTNQRIHMADKDWGNSYSITLFLEDVSSIEMRYSSNILFLTLGIIAALFCAFSFTIHNGESIAGISFIAATVFLILYWVSRKHIVSITSHGGKSLNFEAARLPEYEMQKFLTKVQEVKLQRREQLKYQSVYNV